MAVGCDGGGESTVVDGLTVDGSGAECESGLDRSMQFMGRTQFTPPRLYFLVDTG